MLCLLGPLELVAGDATIHLGGRRQRAILALLALHEGAVVGADTLIDRVWGDDAPASVAKSLTTQLARLRRILEPWGWVLHHTGGGYQLRVGASSLDVREFETRVDGARHAAALDRPEVATGLLERALLLWRGHPLADLADAPFVADAALRLEEEKGEAEDLLTTVLERSGALNRLITLLDRLVDETPFREDRWARLVRALGRAGRRADALQTYERVCRLLADELGVQPGDDLRQAEAAVLLARPAGPRSPRPGLHPFVGRLADDPRPRPAAGARSRRR